jgi:hypothetical protein
VNIEARDASELYEAERALSPSGNLGFLQRCLDEIALVHFAEQSTGRIYGTVERRVVTFVDEAPDSLAKALLEEILPGTSFAKAAVPRYLDAAERTHTVGAWRDG